MTNAALLLIAGHETDRQPHHQRPCSTLLRQP